MYTALNSQTASSTTRPIQSNPRPPRRPLPPPLEPLPRFLLPPNMPLRLSRSFRRASPRSGGPFCSPPPRRPPPPLPPGSWLFELPPGSFQAIALSIQKKLKTRHAHARQCYRKPDASGQLPPRALLQSVLFKEFCRLEAFPADQSVQLYPLQANLKKATALLVMRFGLYR